LTPQSEPGFIMTMEDPSKRALQEEKVWFYISSFYKISLYRISIWQTHFETETFEISGQTGSPNHQKYRQRT
jgi:hypothetical protein